MKQVFYFILGICLVVLTSATTDSLMTVKPSNPKEVLVLTTDAGMGSIKRKIYHYVKSGYIVKSIEGTSQYGHSWIVVMEKY